MDTFTDFLFGVFIGIVLATLFWVIATSDIYQQGQIDAMTGKRSYCLDERFEWVSGQPGEDLRCEGVEQ